MSSIRLKQERLCLLLLIPANILYVLALFSHAWFTLPGTSYGIWWAKFCDYLACHVVPAFFTEEPVWYHIIQILSLVGWIGMILPVAMMYRKFYFIDQYNIKRQQAIAITCIMSGFIISFQLMLFYGKLDESSPTAVPEVQWSAVSAGVACILQLFTGLLLMQ